MTSKHCVLVGGQLQIGCTASIDDYVCDAAKPRATGRMRALHIGVANGDAHKDEVEFETTYGAHRGCEVKHARFIKNPAGARDVILEDFDIIYLSGGNPRVFLLAEDLYNLQARLKRAYDSSSVIVGNSAGALILGNCWTHPLTGKLTASRVYNAFNLVENAAFFAHFNDYAGLLTEDGKPLPPERFLKAIHPVMKRRSTSTSGDFYSFGLWENSALAITWNQESGQQECSVRSLGEREIVYMNGKPVPDFVHR